MGRAAEWGGHRCAGCGALAGHHGGNLFPDDGCKGHAHAAHANGAEYMVIDRFEDGHFFSAHAHDPAPAMFDGIMPAGQNGLGEKPLELLLDLVSDLHFRRRFFFYGFIAGAAEQDAAAEVPEIIESFIEVEGAFEGQSVDGGGDEHLAAGGSDINLRKKLTGEGVGCDEQLGAEQREVVLGVEQDLAIHFFIAGDPDVIQYGDAHRLYEAEEGLAKLPRMELAFGAAFDEVLDAGEAELFDDAVLQLERLLLAGHILEQPVEGVDVGAKLVGVCLGEQLVAAIAFVVDGLCVEGLANSFYSFEPPFHELEELLFAHLFAVGYQFGETAEAGEARVSGAGAGGDQSAVEDRDGELWGQFFEIICAP